MNRSRHVRWLAAAALAVGGILGAWRFRDRAAQPRGDEPAALVSLAAQNRARIEGLRAELQRATAGVASHAARPGPATAYDPVILAEVRSEIEILAVARTMFNRDELVHAELERLRGDPRHVALAVDLATDWQLATALFGDTQAESRVYALALLRHLAEAGDTASVESVVDRIGAQLNTEAPWTKGVEHDYVDALAVYLRSIGLANLLADPVAHFDRIHLSERTSLEVEKALYDSGILKGVPQATLAQVRREYQSYLSKEPPHG